MRQSPLARIVTGTAAVGEGPRANQVWVGGVKSLDILASERPFRCEATSSRPSAKHVVEAAIGVALRGDQAHRAVETIPEAGERPQSSARGFPSHATHVCGGE